MNDYTTFFNPELENILQEIARDPKAKLLKIPSSGQLICATHDPRVSIAAPGLTSAEVELLEVHREELGELLKQRCLIEFFADPEANTRLHRSVDADQKLVVRNDAVWCADTEIALKQPVGDDRTQLAADVLSRCVGRDSRSVSVAQLATAMMRIISSDQPHVYIALELLESKRYSDAIKAYKAAHSRGLSSLLDSYCFEGVSVANWELGRASQAYESIGLAVSTATNRPVPLINAILIAARMGRIQSAKTACSALDSLDCTDDSAARYIPSRAGDRDEVKAMIPLTAEVRRKVARISETVGEMSKEVLRAVVQ